MESETYTVVTSDACGAEMLLYKYFPTHGMSFLPMAMASTTCRRR